jgi:hypothetical protein
MHVKYDLNKTLYSDILYFKMGVPICNDYNKQMMSFFFSL